MNQMYFVHNLNFAAEFVNIGVQLRSTCKYENVLLNENSLVGNNVSAECEKRGEYAGILELTGYA